MLAADEPGSRGRRRPARGRRRGAAGRRPARAAACADRGAARRGRVRALIVDGDEGRVRPRRRLGGTAALVLAARPGGRAGRVRPVARDLRPDDPPARRRGGRHGDRRGSPRSTSAPEAQGPRDKCFVCVCEDVTTKDVDRAVAEGFDSIELSKRYTTVTMGPVPGEALPARLDPALRAQDRRERGRGRRRRRRGRRGRRSSSGSSPAATTSRRAARSMHFRHEEAGATMQWAGPWKRPCAYGEKPEDEVRAVHESLGVIDVSTLGKILVEGPEAAALLERLYPNRFARPAARPHPLRRADVGRRPDHGRRHGRAARGRPLLRHDDLDRRGRGDRVVRVVERGLGLRGRDRERDRGAGGAEPRRAARAGGAARLIEDRTTRRGASSTSTRSSSTSRASRASRFASASSASSGTSSTSRARPASSSGTGSSRRARGRSGSSRSASSGSRRVTSSSARTPTRSRTCSRPRCTGCRSSTRTTSSASSRSSTSPQREALERLVGFTMEDDVVPAEGAQIVIEGRPAGA